MTKKRSYILVSILLALSIVLFSGCNIFIEDKQVVKIELINNIECDYYTSDTNYEIGMAKIKCTYDDNTQTEIEITLDMLSPFNNAAGTHQCTVTYMGKITTFSYTVVAVAVESISIKTSPKASYYTSDIQFDVTNAKLSYTNNDGSTGEASITLDMLSAFNNTAGTHQCTVTCMGKTTTFSYTVVEVVVESISIKTCPKTTYYTSDTQFDVTNAKLSYTNNDGSTGETSITLTMLSAFDNTAGTHQCTVTYMGKTTTFNYTVVAVVVEDISIKTSPKTSYYTSDTQFDVTNAKLSYTNNDGSTGETGITLTMLSAFDNTAGTHECTVTYMGKITTFSYTVVAVAVESISIKTCPKTTYYTSDTQFDVTNAKLSYTNNDGSTGEASITLDMLSPFNNTAGTHQCTVTYMGKTITFSYTVVAVVVESISINTEPKILYNENDTQFDVTNAKLSYTNNDGSTGEVDITLDMLSAFDNTPGIHECTVTYMGKTTSFLYSVSAVKDDDDTVYSLFDHINIQIEDQGSYGLCYAYTATTMAETYFNRIYGVDWQFDVSDIALVINDKYPREDADPNPLNTGGNTQNVIECLKNRGLKIEDGITDQTTFNNSAPVAYFSGYKAFDSNNEMKEYIKEYGSIYAPIYVDQSVFGKTEIYSVEGTINHAISIIGWDNSKSSWLCLNSWGEDWGMENDGCFYLPYNYCVVENGMTGETRIPLYKRSYGVGYGYFASQIIDDYSNEDSSIKQTASCIWQYSYYAVTRENDLNGAEITYVEMVGDIAMDENTQVWIIESETNAFSGFDVTNTSIEISQMEKDSYQCPVINGRVIDYHLSRFTFASGIKITKNYYTIILGRPDNEDLLIIPYSYKSSDHLYYGKSDISGAWQTISGYNLLLNVGFDYSNEIINISSTQQNKFIIDFELDLSNNISITSTIVAGYGYENGNLYIIISDTGYVTLKYDNEYSFNLYFECS